MGSIVGAGMSFLGIKKNQPMPSNITEQPMPSNKKPMAMGEEGDPCPECSVETLPEFPLIVVTRKVTSSGNYDHKLLLIEDKDTLLIFNPTLTDDDIKNLAYRNETCNLDDGTEFKLVTAQEIIIDSNGEFNFWAIKGDSGDFMQVTF